MRKTAKTKKNIPKHKEVSELELLEVIETITKKLAYKFRFGYHDLDDMRQQISIFAIEGLKNYDHTRPLENFLWTHVRNRLFNFKRDNYQRPDKPCTACPFFNKSCADPNANCEKYKNKQDCSLYKSWYTRNNIKKNLMYLNTIDEITNCFQNTSSSSVLPEHLEFIQMLQEELNGESRKIYLKIKYGIKVNKQETKKLTAKIREILNDE